MTRIKAYFFDWMKTLGDVVPDNTEEIKGLVTKNQNILLLTQKFKDADISNKPLVYFSLRDVNLPLYRDSEEIISKLRLNYRLAIVSNMYDITIQRIRKLYPEFLNNFDVLSFSAELGLMKPDPRIWIHTLDRLNETHNLNILPQEVVMVGDSVIDDITPAQNLGMQTKLIDRNKGGGLLDLIK